jgi:hypothetical protein
MKCHIIPAPKDSDLWNGKSSDFVAFMEEGKSCQS